MVQVTVHHGGKEAANGIEQVSVNVNHFGNSFLPGYDTFDAGWIC